MTFFWFLVIFFHENTKIHQILELTFMFSKSKKSNGDKHTELASTVDLENQDQLPVKEVFEGILMIVSQLLS